VGIEHLDDTQYVTLVDQGGGQKTACALMGSGVDAGEKMPVFADVIDANGTSGFDGLAGDTKLSVEALTDNEIGPGPDGDLKNQFLTIRVEKQDAGAFGVEHGGGPLCDALENTVEFSGADDVVAGVNKSQKSVAIKFVGVIGHADRILQIPHLGIIPQFQIENQDRDETEKAPRSISGGL
jgi:hypothetical protein